MNIYEAGASPELREKIISWGHFSLEEIERLWAFLLLGLRRPKSHPRQATPEEEAKILSDFEKVKIGAQRLKKMLERKKELGKLTLAKLRWIYRRNDLRVRKVRTKNWETRSLYDYRTIGAFEDMHYDTKEIADAKSLPEEAYANLKNNGHLPLYEWNLIDVASRSRFIAYSRGKSSTFWLQFLIFTLSHLRYHGISNHIRVHTDGGSEFFSGSKRKQKEWNSIIGELDADIDCYNPNWDIRKNLIERSHRSDDEEFLIPFGANMKTKKQFMIQSQEYSDYWNTLRSHSGKGMYGRTPKEKLRALWICNAWAILAFEVLHLDESFHLLQEHLEYFQFQRLLRATPKEQLISERKIWLDLLTRYPHMRSYAQNVLTYY
ncbi:MAG: integrase catalytic region, partial [uncultured bacterium (gcode 4)]